MKRQIVEEAFEKVKRKLPIHSRHDLIEAHIDGDNFPGHWNKAMTKAIVAMDAVLAELEKNDD